MDVWKTWSYGTLAGVSTMYGAGGQPPERGVVSWGERRTTVDYPPGTLYALAALARVYRIYDPAYSDRPALTAVLKLSLIAADGAIAACIWILLRRRDAAAARAGALFYWLNPAAIMDGAVLGYLDPWAGALVLAAIVAADTPSSIPCGVLAGAAVLTKAQAVFAIPAIALTLSTRAAASRMKRASIGTSAGIATIAVALLPFARRGALPNLMQGVGSLFRHDMLSATAANLWWIVTWLLRASYAMKDLGGWAAWTMTVRILGVSRVVALGYPNPRPIGVALAGVVMLWAFWRARRGPVSETLAAGALATHAYFVLAVQVHENHLYLAIPLMAAAAALLPRLRGPL